MREQSHKSDVGYAATQESKSEGQNRMCTLTTSQAPDIRGLRLGMSLEQVLALFPGSAADAEVKKSLEEPAKFGVMRLTIRPEKYASKEISSARVTSRWFFSAVNFSTLL